MDELNPALIANYTYDLVKLYNQFYQSVPILKEENEELVKFRLALSGATAATIKKAMKLLGIEVPDRM
jgi:arginyl-tRNA synthetase